MDKLKIGSTLFFLVLYTGLSSQPIVRFKDDKGKYGIKDPQGKVLVEPKYDYASEFERGMIRVIMDEKIGYVNRKGIEIIPTIYKSAYYISGTENLYKVELNEKNAIIDTLHNQIVPFKYNSISTNYRDGMMEVWQDRKRGFIDIHGHEVIPVVYDYLETNYEGEKIISIIVSKNGKYGLIYKTNQELLETKFELIKYAYRSIIVKEGGKYGLFDFTGKVILPIEFDYLETDMMTDRVMAKRNGKFVLMDLSGNKLSEAKYEMMDNRTLGNKGSNGGVGFFSVGVLTGSNYKFGYIDHNGKELTEIKYSFCDDLKNNYAIVVLNGKYGLVDTKGEEIIKPDKFDKLNYPSDGLIAVNLGGKWTKNESNFEGGKWGYIDLNGNELIKNQFQEAGDFMDGKARVKLNGKYIYIDKEGNEIK